LTLCPGYPGAGHPARHFPQIFSDPPRGLSNILFGAGALNLTARLPPGRNPRPAPDPRPTFVGYPGCPLQELEGEPVAVIGLAGGFGEDVEGALWNHRDAEANLAHKAPGLRTALPQRQSTGDRRE